MAKRILIFFVLAGLLGGPADLSSCGPFFPVTVFSAKSQPLDEPQFFRGQLGVLMPQYRRIYLIAAYRYLSGIGLSKEDQQALITKSDRPDYSWMDSTSPAMQGWLQVRIQVGAPPFDQVDPAPIVRTKMLPGYVAIVNCGDDAFRNATATLTEHARAGAAHDDLRAWVAAQDQVFDNCSDPQPGQPHPKPAGPSIPAPLPPAATAWMRADRAYQIAAAEFYAGQFDAAAADFIRIGADRASPWHAIAPYLAARALVRKTSIDDPSAAAAAQEQLRKVLIDPGAAAWHESARGLSRYLRARTDPDAVVAELARIVATRKTGAVDAMNDYRLMLGRFMDRGKQPPRDEDITDWIAAMQYTPDDHALAKWRETRSLPWLVAALMHADEPNPDLMAAAAQVPESSPAFSTVELNRLRLMPPDAARPGLDAALQHKMPADERNLFRAARMHVARDWDDFLHYAPRTAVSTFVDGWRAEYQPILEPVQYFDDDAAGILNQTPLAKLRSAVESPRLPPNLRLQVARVVWTRSILMSDTATAASVAPELAALDQQAKPLIEAYLAAPDEKARAFAAVWLMLKNPGLRIAVDAGAGRATSTPKIDSFRDNWWCPATAPADSEAAPTFMARQAVEWIQSHPNDPRAPEALHLAVRAAHYACGGDGDTGRWAKRAFDMLHSRYPKTDAARLTPYWYGEHH